VNYVYLQAQVRISDPGISEAYHRITAADPEIDYMLLSYIGQTNDLKVQEQGTGGLAELQDGWNDGRIQFAFVRVKEAGSGLTKFVLIAWVRRTQYRYFEPQAKVKEY
jgi:hypothetical protein